MIIDCAANEYEIIDKGLNFEYFEVIVVYSENSKKLIETEFYNRGDEVRVAV